MITLTSPVKTWAHRVPALPKVVIMSVSTMGLFALDGLIPLAACLVGAGALVLTGGAVFARAMLGTLRVLVPFLVIVGVWHVLSNDVLGGLAIVTRLLAAFTLANFVTMTTPLTEMLGVMTRLLSPLRRIGVNTGAFEIAVPLALRSVPAIQDRAGRLSESWRARSLRRPGWKIILPLAGLALDDADQVAEALKARGGIR